MKEEERVDCVSRGRKILVTVPVNKYLFFSMVLESGASGGDWSLKWGGRTVKKGVGR